MGPRGLGGGRGQGGAAAVVIMGGSVPRCVLYARVSSDDRKKEGRNLKSQIQMGQEYAHDHGYQVVGS